MGQRSWFPARNCRSSVIPTSNFCCSATAPNSSRCSPPARSSRPPRTWCTPMSRCRWTTSRARRCARDAGRSSMWLAIDAVKKGEADVAVSAGNTGALMAMAKIRPADHGRDRAAGDRGHLADAEGATRSCSTSAPRSAPMPSNLVDMAVMGSAMARSAVRSRPADGRAPQYRRGGGEGARGGARGRADPARADNGRSSSISASSRATTSARARSTWW